jgi:hypothetical protein
VVQAPVDVKKNRAYWDEMQEEFCIIFYDKTKHKHIATWTEVYGKNGTPYYMATSSPEVENWLTHNLQGECKVRPIRIAPFDVPHGMQELKRHNAQAIAYRWGSVRDYLVRFCIIFENEIDMIHFKLRWY